MRLYIIGFMTIEITSFNMYGVLKVDEKSVIKPAMLFTPNLLNNKKRLSSKSKLELKIIYLENI